MFGRAFISILLCLFVLSCATNLKKATKPAMRIYRGKELTTDKYSSFKFTFTSDSLNYLLENYLQTQLEILLESKGYERSDSPDFNISILWETSEEKVLYDIGFIATGESSLGFFGYWSEQSQLITLFYRHNIVITMHDAVTQQQLWRADTQIYSSSSDIRYSLNSMFKNTLFYFPSIGQSTRRGLTLQKSTIDDVNKFGEYVNQYIAERDFSFPGFQNYVTFDKKFGGVSFNKGIRNVTENIEYLPLFIDLLEYGNYYYVDDNQILLLVGKYDVYGRLIFMKVKAKPNISGKYHITDLEDINLEEYEAIINVIREKEKDYRDLHDFFN